MIATVPPKQYYVRASGKIRGPFDVARLKSMRQRGKLSPRDELSLDRRNWTAAGAVTDVFPDGFTTAEPDLEAADWYCMRAGQQQGPMLLAALQSLIQTGDLTSHDSVWRLGTPGWVLASQIPELSFSPQRSWWNSLRLNIRVGIVGASILLALLPVWLMIGHYRERAVVERQEARQRKEDKRWQEEQDQRKAELAVQERIAKSQEKLLEVKQRDRESSSTPSFSGFQAGDRVKNRGLMVKWKGMVTRIDGPTLYVRVDYADRDLARRVSKGSQVQPFTESEVELDSGGVSALEIWNGFREFAR